MPKYVYQNVVEVIGLEDPNAILRKIEHCGRIAHASWDREQPGTAEKFIQMIIRLGHESVLEHASVTVIFQLDRSTAQQLTRYRVASYTMESQRYCNYSASKFGGEVTFVYPEFDHSPNISEQTVHNATSVWLEHIEKSEMAYFHLLGLGLAPEDARSVLSNSTACKLAVTANLREWRHIFKQRTKADAQHNVRHLMNQTLAIMRSKISCVFNDIDNIP